jgi:predicted DNA-binding transcriptional regulator AlpA
MKARKILRPKEAWARFGRGKTAFETNYRFHSPGDPFVPGTTIERLKPIRLGPRSVGFLEHEVDRLIDQLAEAGGHAESRGVKAARDAGTGTRRVFITDRKPEDLNK